MAKEHEELTQAPAERVDTRVLALLIAIEWDKLDARRKRELAGRWCDGEEKGKE